MKQLRLHLTAKMAQTRISLSELADRTGLSLDDLKALRDNRAKAIRFETLALLCQAFSCQPHELFCYSDDTQSDKAES